MNRQLRRSLEASLRRSARNGQSTLAHPVPTSFRLDGGPMDGWVVKDGAPALDPEWHTTWPDAIAAVNRPGRYVIVGPHVGTSRRARWRPV